MAEKTGVPPSKIRYYEKMGVLPPPERAPSGYRAYDAEAVARLAFLQRGKLLGLTLAELADVLRAAEEGCCGLGDPLLGQLLREKLAEVDHRIAELQALRSTLERAMNRLAGATAAPETAQAGLACISVACTTRVVAPRRR